MLFAAVIYCMIAEGIALKQNLIINSYRKATEIYSFVRIAGLAPFSLQACLAACFCNTFRSSEACNSPCIYSTPQHYLYIT
jgi:hypothetical protein